MQFLALNLVVVKKFEPGPCTKGHFLKHPVDHYPGYWVRHGLFTLKG
jgi:hypothetical protein